METCLGKRAGSALTQKYFAHWMHTWKYSERSHRTWKALEHLEQYCAILGRLDAILGRLGGVLARLGAILGRLGTILARFGRTETSIKPPSPFKKQ